MDDQRPAGEERTSAGRPVNEVRGDEPGRSYFTALGKWPEEAGITRSELARRTGGKPATISALLNNSGPKPTSPTALDWATKIIKACGGGKQDLANWATFHTEVLKYQTGAVEQLPPLPEPGKEYGSYGRLPERLAVDGLSHGRPPRTARFRTRMGSTVVKVVSLVVVPLLAGGAGASSGSSRPATDASAESDQSSSSPSPDAPDGEWSVDPQVEILAVEHTFRPGTDRITITVRNTRADPVLVKKIDLYMDVFGGAGHEWTDTDEWHFTVLEQMYPGMSAYDGSRRTHGVINMSGSEFSLPLVGQGFINQKGGWRRLLTFAPQKFLEEKGTVSIVIDMPTALLLQKTSAAQPAGPMVEHEFNPERGSLLTYVALETPDGRTFACNYLRRREDQPECSSVDPIASVTLPR